MTLDAPVLTVEILSPDDTLNELVAKSQEYLGAGVRVPVIADPYQRRVYVVLESGAREIESNLIDFTVADLSVTIDFNRLFGDLDQD